MAEGRLEVHPEEAVEPGTLYSGVEMACSPAPVAGPDAQSSYSTTDTCHDDFEIGAVCGSGRDAANASDDEDDNNTKHIEDQYPEADSALLLSQYPLSSRDPCLVHLPNEVLMHVLDFLDVSDLLATSRTNHLLRHLCLSPILHHYRLRRTRLVLPPLLASPARPSIADLIARSIFLTQTSVVSRRLAWSLVSIRLSRRLAARPSAEALVERSVLPKECVPGMASVYVAPGLVAKRKAIEKEKVKDGLRRWIAAKWKSEVREREEDIRRWHESRGVGRVWRLTRFWERVSRGDVPRVVTG